jgi:hypothetical protein
MFINVNGFQQKLQINVLNQPTKHILNNNNHRNQRKLIKRHGLHTDIPFQNPDHDLLLRVARGEVGERTPVWLMRQAGWSGAGF